MRFGAHVNAHTSFDETVYQLQIPTDNPAVIDRSLLILEDWAHNVSFEPAEIDKERGVVLEEWRLGLGADERHPGHAVSDPAQRLALRRAAADRQARDHPERQSRAAEAVLRRLVPARPDGGHRRRRLRQGRDRSADQVALRLDPGGRRRRNRGRPTRCPISPGTLYSVTTDPEATATHIGVYGKMAARDQRTVGAYRQQMVERLFARHAVGAARRDRAAAERAVSRAPQTDRGLFVRTEEATTLDALVPEGGVERGLSALFTEIDRVARFGFTATELNRQKLNLQRYLETAVVEKDKSPSGPLADEFVRNFVQDEPIPGIVYEYGLNQRFLPEITLAEVNALAQGLDARSQPASSSISAPEKDRPALPTEAKLAAVIKAAERRDR